ncbi:MAG: LicD family protein [Phascolarctobacterium sp.]|uniref:LicD family protein n=1 Tax=Phascolarctobacterium sp. TaxID=2049039 RepID=UPI0026DAFA55|nr:LicD family protein [Phascolarctobacterium sp.]MDO4920366.1 LicD family protein [Phascolarctobacterium sp.]
MRELSISEIKRLQLDMLIEFAKFCDKNSLTYYLGGGTLLGAVRHKGFIPWDDDIDIMMPRKDFNKAILLYKNEIYRLNYITNTKAWCEQIAKLCDIRTYVYDDSFKNTEIDEINCLGIDICPIDGLPDEIWKQKVLFLVSRMIIAIHSASVLSFKTTKRFADKPAGIFHWKKSLRNIVKYVMIFLFGRTDPQYWVKLLNRLVTKEDFYNHEYVAALVSCVHGSKEKMPSRIYEPKIKLEFEEYKFWAPADYDYYLKRLYGKYMELPAPEHRVAHHGYKVYIKNNIWRKTNA